MIYLILDTNIWIYLANGLDTNTNKYDDNLHFQLLAELSRLKVKGDICLLINDVIVEEINRNKENSLSKIKQLEKKLSSSSSTFGSIKKYVKSDLKTLEKEFKDGVEKDIQANKNHLQNLEKFLQNHCQSIEITQDLKLKIFDWSTKNEAPFHNKRNNTADASILFSASEYLKNNPLNEDISAIFVSNNISDFTNGKEKNEFHPDIQKKLSTSVIKYERFLSKAVALSKEIIEQLEEYSKREAMLESIEFTCRGMFCENNENFSPWGYLDEKLDVIYQDEHFVDPNQLSLFDMPKQITYDKTIRMGRCLICDTIHFECPECGEVICSEEEGEFQCPECLADLEIIFDDGICLIVKDTSENTDIEN